MNDDYENIPQAPSMSNKRKPKLLDFAFPNKSSVKESIPEKKEEKNEPNFQEKPKAIIKEKLELKEKTEIKEEKARIFMVGGERIWGTELKNESLTLKFTFVGNILLVYCYLFLILEQKLFNPGVDGAY